jgi:hypothetical protein
LEADWGLTKGGVRSLPPFLQKIQRLNDDYNKRLLITKAIQILARYACRQHGILFLEDASALMIRQSSGVNL